MYKRTFICVVLVAICCLRFASAGVVFTGRTSDVSTSTFVVGSNVVLRFSASKVGRLIDSPKIYVRVVDADGRMISRAELVMNRVSQGDWSATYVPPHKALGFYRVYAVLHIRGTLVSLRREGSRPSGYLTYCIVMDPRMRKAVSESTAFFGMQGGFGKATEKLLPLLGVHWVLGNLDWEKYYPVAPDRDILEGTKAAWAAYGRSHIEPLTASYNGRAWRLLPLPTLEVRPPIWLLALPWGSRLVEWRRYCRQAALLFSKQFPKLSERIYQVTWEPNFKWQFDGTPKQLVKWQEIAYLAVHKADSRAVVIGPTGSRVDSVALAWTSNLISLGITKYLDGWSLHPYTNPHSGNSFREIQLKDALLKISGELEKASGRAIPIYSTEAGDQALPDAFDELRQARYLVESNVIMDAIGVRLSIAFYIADFPNPSNYGLYYNDINGLPFGAAKLSPKPAAAAFAAMTSMLDGARPDGFVSLGPMVEAYKFVSGTSHVIVAWTTNVKSARVNVNASPSKVEIYDWMGNLKGAESDKGIRVSSDPSYIIY